jgi:predicted hotdog family 3-hydroxylacyl-ACP dehydratase
MPHIERTASATAPAHMGLLTHRLGKEAVPSHLPVLFDKKLITHKPEALRFFLLSTRGLKKHQFRLQIITHHLIIVHVV